jgi:O-antigen/teichoic acid export membrane protein
MPTGTLKEQPQVVRQFDPGRQAFLNGCVNFARGLLSVAVTIMLTPFLVSHLGLARFGVWSLLGVFVTYMTLVDLGISGATAKFIGGLSQGEDRDRLNRVFTTAMGLMIGIALGAILLGPLLRHNLENKLARFGLVGDDATLFLIGAMALYSVGIVANGLSYVLLGLHRLDVANYIASSVLLLQAVGTVLVLRAGYGLRGLIVLITGVSALSIVAYFVAVRKLAPCIRFYWKSFSVIAVRDLLSFGLYLQAYGLLCVYYIFMGKAVVSLRFPLAAVAAYEVALRLPVLCRQGISSILGPIMPAVAHLDARGRPEEVRALLLRVLRYSLLFGAPVFVGVAIFAEPVVRLWVGAGFASSVPPLRILSLAFGFSVFPDLAWFFLVGLGRQRSAMILSLLQVLLGTLLSNFLAGRWGLDGVALGVFGTSCLGVLLYGTLLVRERVVSFADLPVSLAIKVVGIAGTAFLVSFGALQSFPLTYWNFALSVFVPVMVYCIWIARGGLLEGRERLFLRGLVPSYLHFLC